MSKVTHRFADPRYVPERESWRADCSCGGHVAGEERAEADLLAHVHARTDGDFWRGIDWLSDVRNLPDDDLTFLRFLLTPGGEVLDGVSRSEHPAAWHWLYGVFARLQDEHVRRDEVLEQVQIDMAGGHLTGGPGDLRDEGEGWLVWCSCDWSSESHPDEDAAREAARAHVAEFWATVPEGVQVRGAACDLVACQRLDVTCSRCRAVRYVGPDCEHVPQPVPVSSEGVCVDCREAIR